MLGSVSSVMCLYQQLLHAAHVECIILLKSEVFFNQLTLHFHAFCVVRWLLVVFISWSFTKYKHLCKHLEKWVLPIGGKENPPRPIGRKVSTRLAMYAVHPSKLCTSVMYRYALFEWSLFFFTCIADNHLLHCCNCTAWTKLATIYGPLLVRGTIMAANFGLGWPVLVPDQILRDSSYNVLFFWGV